MIGELDEALAEARAYEEQARQAVAARLVDKGALDREQRAAHGYAWIETSVEALAAIKAGRASTLPHC